MVKTNLYANLSDTIRAWEEEYSEFIFWQKYTEGRVRRSVKINTHFLSSVKKENIT